MKDKVRIVSIAEIVEVTSECNAGAGEQGDMTSSGSPPHVKHQVKVSKDSIKILPL